MDSLKSPVIRIAVVDDDKTLLSVFSSMMKSAGYHTHFFSRPANALDEIKAVKGHYHLVITDLRMPDMDGIAFAKQIRQSEPHLPIILMSGDIPDEVREEAARVGYVTFLEKPFPVESTLKELIPRLLRGEG